MNGYRVEVSADDGETFIVERVIAEHLGVHEIAAWLGERMHRLSAKRRR
jgi:hypothetical protein